MPGRLRNLSIEQIDRETVLHPFTVLRDFSDGTLGDPRIVDSGIGCRIRDTKGNEFIDAFAGLYCVNIGYGRQDVADAIHAQAKKLAFYQSYAAHSTEQLIRLSERLVAMSPGEPAQRVLRPVRVRRQRDAGQARLVLQQRVGPAEEEEDHRARAGLSRRHDHVGQPDRPVILSHGLRSAGLRRAPHARAALLAGRAAGRDGGGLLGALRAGSRGDDPCRRARYGRSVHRRARAGNGRDHPAAARILRGHPAGAAALRHPDHLR